MRSNTQRVAASPKNDPPKRAAMSTTALISQPDGMEWEDAPIPRKPKATGQKQPPPRTPKDDSSTSDDEEEGLSVEIEEEEEVGDEDEEDNDVQTKDTREAAGANKHHLATTNATNPEAYTTPTTDAIAKNNPSAAELELMYPLPTDTVDDSLCRHLVSLLRDNNIPSPSTTSSFIAQWSAIARDPAIFQDKIKHRPIDSIGAPLMLLALDAATSTVVVLHHFDHFQEPNQPPQLVAFCDDRVNDKAPPQLVFLNAQKICAQAAFAFPSLPSTEVLELEPYESVPSPRGKKRTPCNLLLPLPPHWALLFLEDGNPMPANIGHLALITFASSLRNLPDKTAYDLVTAFAWGLITRRTPKALLPALAVPIHIPRTTRALADWNDDRLSRGTIFSPLNLTSDSDPPRPVPPSASKQPPPQALVPPPRVLGPHPSHPSLDDATPSAALPTRAPMFSPVAPAPASAAPIAQPPDSTMALMQQANLNLMNTMQAYFSEKGKRQRSDDDDDDDSDKDDAPAGAKQAKFTALKAAPFHGWAGFRPGHLFKKIPRLFRDLIEASSAERHGIITSFFHQLERSNARTFAGFKPTEDLCDDLAKLKLAPPQGYGTKWHRGLGPMAFAPRSLGDTDLQTTNMDLRSTYGSNLVLSVAEARKLESGPPLVPTDFEAFLLVLTRFAEFHSATLGPECDLVLQTQTVIRNLTRLRLRVSRSPEFMLQRAPSILWAITLATQDFFSEAITASQFQAAEDNELDPPVVRAYIDVADLSKLQLTEACDIPAFLKHAPTRPAPLPRSPNPYSPASHNPPRTGATPGRNTNNPPSPALVNDNPHLSPAFQRLFAACSTEQRKSIGLRKILDGCPGNPSYPQITAKLGASNSDCLRYHIIGHCGLRTCQKNHVQLAITPAQAQALSTLLQPGVTALL
jgi:hypothetical protein